MSGKHPRLKRDHEGHERFLHLSDCAVVDASAVAAIEISSQTTAFTSPRYFFLGDKCFRNFKIHFKNSVFVVNNAIMARRSELIKCYFTSGGDEKLDSMSQTTMSLDESFAGISINDQEFYSFLVYIYSDIIMLPLKLRQYSYKFSQTAECSEYIIVSIKDNAAKWEWFKRLTQMAVYFKSEFILTLCTNWLQRYVEANFKQATIIRECLLLAQSDNQLKAAFQFIIFKLKRDCKRALLMELVSDMSQFCPETVKVLEHLHNH